MINHLSTVADLESHVRNAADLISKGNLIGAAELLADSVGLIKHLQPSIGRPIPGIHVNTPAGFIVIGGLMNIPAPISRLKSSLATGWGEHPKPAVDFVPPSPTPKVESSNLCPECGKLAPADSQACPNCGSVL